jgi:hypothetical protein
MIVPKSKGSLCRRKIRNSLRGINRLVKQAVLKDCGLKILIWESEIVIRGKGKREKGIGNGKIGNRYSRIGDREGR